MALQTPKMAVVHQGRKPWHADSGHGPELDPASKALAPLGQRAVGRATERRHETPGDDRATAMVALALALHAMAALGLSASGDRQAMRGLGHW